MQKQKGMLTSHELGFYKDFASYEKPKVPKVANEKPMIADRDYLYLYLKKISVRSKVSITQKELAEKLSVTIQTIRRGQHRLEKCGLLERVKEADPIARQPMTFKVIKLNDA